jgi:hypothetical protein
MTPEELEASLERQKVLVARIKRSAVPKLLKVLSPFYDPAKRRDPQGLQEFLQEFEQRPAALAA